MVNHTAAERSFPPPTGSYLLWTEFVRGSKMLEKHAAPGSHCYGGLRKH